MSRYSYGFELEGFYANTMEEPVVPPKDYPTDGFPGLIEFRSTGGESLHKAFSSLLENMFLYDLSQFRPDIYSHKYSPEQRRELRRRHGPPKFHGEIRNIYGKKPKELGNRTIASFQISISNKIANEYRDDKNVYHKAQYSLLDIDKIVKALDKEFEEEIKQSKRQPGEYAIKEQRLEYRSLPNSVFTYDIRNQQKLLDRILKAVEGS